MFPNSFAKDNPGNVTRATAQPSFGMDVSRNPQADFSAILNETTSRRAKAVIKQIANEDNKPRPDLLGKSVAYDNGDITRLSGARPDDETDRNQSAVGLMRSSATLRNLGASMMQQPPTSRLTSALNPFPQALQPNPLSSQSQQKFFSPPQPTPNTFRQPSFPLPGDPFYLPPAKAELTSWRNEQTQQNRESLEKYITTLVDKVAAFDEQRKDFKNYDKAALDAKDDEIRTFLVGQKKADEARRVEIENRLRDIFKEKTNLSTGYSPSEGFLLQVDFILTYFSRFEDVYVRFAVYLIGDKISRTYRSGKCLAENYLANMNRVFFGEKQVVENIDNDREAVVIFEVINVTNSAGVASSELVGWSMLRLFDDSENFL